MGSQNWQLRGSDLFIYLGQKFGLGGSLILKIFKIKEPLIELSLKSCD
jgi:hypothetical protein